MVECRPLIAAHVRQRRGSCLRTAVDANWRESSNQEKKNKPLGISVPKRKLQNGMKYSGNASSLSTLTPLNLGTLLCCFCRGALWEFWTRPNKLVKKKKLWKRNRAALFLALSAMKRSLCRFAHFLAVRRLDVWRWVRGGRRGAVLAHDTLPAPNGIRGVTERVC